MYLGEYPIDRNINKIKDNKQRIPYLIEQLDQIYLELGKLKDNFVSKDLRDLIRGLLKVYMTERFDFREIFTHPFINKNKFQIRRIVDIYEDDQIKIVRELQKSDCMKYLNKFYDNDFFTKRENTNQPISFKSNNFKKKPKIFSKKVFTKESKKIEVNR